MFISTHFFGQFAYFSLPIRPISHNSPYIWTKFLTAFSTPTKNENSIECIPAKQCNNVFGKSIYHKCEAVSSFASHYATKLNFLVFNATNQLHVHHSPWTIRRLFFPLFVFFRHFFIQRCTISKKPDLAAESKATNCRVNDTINVVFREVFALSTQARHIFIKKANPIFKRIDARFSPAPP